jgi:hypothetical protein
MLPGLPERLRDTLAGPTRQRLPSIPAGTEQANA